MKAIQKIKQFASKITSITLFGTGSRPPVVTGVAPLARSVVTSAAPSKRHTGDSHTFVLRQRPFLSLYSYLTSRRIFTLWRSRTYIQNLRNIRIAGLSSSFLLGLLALAIIIPLYNVTGTEDTEAATGTAIDSSITFTSTRSAASVAFNPTSTSGTFASSTAGTSDAAFSITTTNSQGYTLKLKSSNGTDLKTSTSAGTTSTLSTISTNTGIESNSFTANTWGYLPSYYNSSANTTKYYPATTTDITLRTTSSANTTNTSDSYTIGIGAKADLTREAGTYTLGGNSSAMVLSYAVNPTAYEISYKDNSGDSTVANMPTTTQSGSVSATSVALAPNKTPTRTGYSLTGWCLGTVSNAGTSCSGTSIATNGTLALDRTTSNSATLYAIWTPNKYTCTKQYRLQNTDGTWGSYTTDTTEQVAYNSTCSYSKTVTDYKGSETGSNGSAASTSATMNSTSGITLQVSLYRNTYALTVDKDSTYISSVTGSGTYRWGEVVPITATVADNSEFTTWTESTTTGTFADANSASTTFTMSKSDTTIMANGKTSKLWFQNASSANCGSTMYDNRGNDTYKNVAYTTAMIGSLCWMTRNLDLPGGTTLTPDDTNLTTGFTLPASSTSGFSEYNTDYVYNSSSTYNDTSCGSGNPCYSYYSFYTATAHWGTQSAWSGISSVDICPKGWRLPTQAEYSTLVSSYNTGAKLVASPFYGVYSGQYISGSFYDGGSYGYYWSSTVVNNSYAYLLNFGSSSAGTDDYVKGRGFAVRCVTKPRYNVTIATTNNATGIVINGTTYSNGDTVPLFAGDTYTISGTYASGYYFDSWSVTSGGTLGSATSDPTTLTVTSDVTLTLTGTNKLWFQNATSADCGKTMYDRRGNDTYKNIAYTTATIGSLCWMTRNLDLPGGTALTSSDTNLTTGFTLPASSTSGFSSYNTDYVYNSGSTTCSWSSACYSYYSFYTATAHWGTNSVSSGSSSKDICPKGWRLPTKDEYGTLKGTYTSGATLTASPFYGVYSGYYDGSFVNGGSYGLYWSSYVTSANHVYPLYFNSSSASITNALKKSGLAVRCVAKS